MRRFVAVGALLSFAAGCTWIDDAQREARRGQVDDDGDGVIAAEDCDDGDPSISTAEPEVWYDGIDSDCGGDDDYDQDGDGYVPAEFVGLTTLKVKGSGTLPGGDCDDREPMVSPQQKDTWYDGVDRSCDGGDDYDKDGDGYVPDEYIGLATKYVGTSGLLPGGDCDDDNSAVNPNVVDTSYDGLDSDCSGNNDYDNDGDGYVPDEWFGVAGGLPSGDCDDDDDAVHPYADEIFYNGIDDACDGRDDFDQDEDGYVRTGDAGRVTEGVANTGSLPAGDCDDTNENARPYANETYGDGVDEDCDGGRDSLQLNAVAGFLFTDAHTPVFVEARDRVYLSVAAGDVVTPTSHWYASGFAMTWDAGFVANDPSLVGEFAWAKSANPTTFEVGYAHAFREVNDTLYGVIGRQGTRFRALAFESYPLGAGTAGQATAQSNNLADDNFEDADIFVDDSGRVHGVGCDGGSNGVFTYARVDDLATSTSADVQVNETPGVASAVACAFLNTTDLAVLAARSDDLYTYAFDSDSVAPTFSGTAEGSGWVAADIDTSVDGSSPLEVLALPTQVYVSGTGISALVGQMGDVPLAADAVRLADGSYLIAWVNDDGSARLAIGNDASGFAYVTVSFDDVATGIAVWADEDNGMVAVTSDTQVAVGVYDW
jgi:hypothetical protein